MMTWSMTDKDRAQHATWRAASGHPGGWRVCRHFHPPLNPTEGQPRFQEARGVSGRLRLFRSRSAAQRVADQLNRKKALA